MKNSILIFAIISINSFVYCQIGIGTKNPLAELHVAGDILVQDKFLLNSLNTVNTSDEDFKLITRKSNSTALGEITQLDVSKLSVSPVNTIDYHFTNIKLDNLKNVNLQYDEDKYIVAISNFRYIGDAIRKDSYPGGKKSIGQFVVRTFISNGTWRLEIQNRDLDLRNSDSLEYYVTLIVYDKSFFKQLPVITTNLSGSLDGTASSVPNLN